MVVDHNNKRKKFHDKDKYYRLAKEQGLRSRASFKLSQINRKYPILEKCQHGILDLCAAPGGWTQIAARTCPNKHIPIIAVDILPIRSMKTSHPNVITLIGDITTDQCKADIKRTLLLQEQHQQQQQSKNNKKNSKQQNNLCCDVVLHDGAPNIGAEYGKDAYIQNEMTLHAIKVATQHLTFGGTFITKVYRSRDYNSILWTLQQLFNNVHAFKPKASRIQSSEIYLICLEYKAPIKGVDPKLLDPKYIFDNSITDERNNSSGETIEKRTNVFDKNYDKKKPTRQRGGYDLDHYDFSMRHIESVMDYVHSKTLKDAITILSRSTGLSFDNNNTNKNNDSNMDNENEDTILSDYIKNHPLTTNEIKESLNDLQVLNKSDFKALLKWRDQMQEAIKNHHSSRIHHNDSMKDDDDSTTGDNDGDKCNDDDDESDEEMVQAEIEQMRQRRMKEKKRKMKKERMILAKRRKHAALVGGNIDASNTVDLDQEGDLQIFSLASINSKKALEQIASDVNLDQISDEQLFGNPDDENNNNDIVIGKDPDDDDDDDDDNDDDDNDDNDNNKRKLLRKRERELNEAYELYLQTTKDGLAKSGTKMAKRSKKLQRQKVLEEAIEDQEMTMTTDEGLSYDAQAYAKLLQGQDDDDDDDESEEDSEDDDDGYNEEPMTPEESANRKMKLKQQENKKSSTAVSSSSSSSNNTNPLIHQFADNEPTSAKTSRWFSNPLFAAIGKKVAEGSAATINAESTKANKKQVITDEEDSDNESGMNDSDNEKHSRNDKKRKKQKKDDKKGNNLTAEDVLAMMPKTDKQKRHEKRLKQMEKDKSKQEQRARKSGGEDENNNFDMEVVAADDDDKNDDSKHLSADRLKKIKEAKELIKAGMGKLVNHHGDDDEKNNDQIEIVPSEENPAGSSGLLPVMDDRKYDSDHEDYDSDDYAETLALGTMIVRSKVKEKAFVDASYNRYAWNDPKNLPEWFVDDEKKHYRPQLPIPPALIAKMKQQMISLSTKPIKKVAEARARKRKRATIKLKAAQKKAEAVAKSTEMSEAMKLKAISKTLQQGRSGKDSGGKGSKYVVAKKGRNVKAAKGSKVVDKRLKSDTRSMKRVEKKRKNGGKLPKRRR